MSVSGEPIVESALMSIQSVMESPNPISEVVPETTSKTSVETSMETAVEPARVGSYSKTAMIKPAV